MFTITGYSTALFSTWYFIEELGILLDAGDGVSSGLLQKSRKVTHVFVSHADRDHLTGLLQFNQLNARLTHPIICYPHHAGSFPAMEQFSKKFDYQLAGQLWIPIKDKAEVIVGKDIVVEAVRNNHIEVAAHITKSLGFKIYNTKTKLKPEIASLPQEQIKKLMMEGDKSALTVEVRTNLLTYSGDTPVDDYERWNNSKVLIHEATFLGGEEDAKLTPHSNKHSTLEEVIRMVAEINVETLILGHFSSRYSAELIDERIRQLCKTYKIKIPVYRVLPGQIHRNILNETPVYFS